MDTYAKLASSIVRSTVWREPDHIRILWITILALKDSDGEVFGSVPGLADTARITEDQCIEGLNRLMSPDPKSRTKTSEGRRLEEIQGGWRVVNHDIYRKLANADERRERDAERKRVTRSARESSADVRSSPQCPPIRAEQSRSNQEGDPERARDYVKESDVRADVVKPDVVIPVGAVARTYSLPSKEPPKEYLDVALMGGVSPKQARSTWSHYWGQGLPPGGVERLHDWLVQRAIERSNSQARGRPEPASAHQTKGIPAAEALKNFQ